MKIEAGKYYRTRDGITVGPMRATPESWSFNDMWAWTSVDEEPDTYGFGIWLKDGFSYVDPIVSEAPDLTAITTPFSLLDEATREALKAHSGPWEFYCGTWKEVDRPMWNPETVYRVKPQPPKPREWWIYAGDLYRSFGEAINQFGANKNNVIHVREVIDNA